MSTTTERRPWRGPVVVAVAVVCVVAGALLGWFARDAGEAGQPLLSDADIAFAQQMSVHHQQALTMVDMLGPEVARDVRAAAEQIRISQWREIGTLTGWLELVGAPLQAPATANGHHGAHAGPGPSMAGMASNEELTRLYNATGRDREILFLQLMIRHHQGGIEMAAAAERSAAPAVRTRALSMVNGQQQEIASMSVLLHQRGGQVLPYP